MKRDRCSQTLANNCAAGIEDALCAALVFAETFSRNLRKISCIWVTTADAGEPRGFAPQPDNGAIPEAPTPRSLRPPSIHRPCVLSPDAPRTVKGGFGLRQCLWQYGSEGG